jgi:hypothetical protein
MQRGPRRRNTCARRARREPPCLTTEAHRRVARAIIDCASSYSAAGGSCAPAPVRPPHLVPAHPRLLHRSTAPTIPTREQERCAELRPTGCHQHTTAAKPPPPCGDRRACRRRPPAAAPAPTGFPARRAAPPAPSTPACQAGRLVWAGAGRARPLAGRNRTVHAIGSPHPIRPAPMHDGRRPQMPGPPRRARAPPAARQAPRTPLCGKNAARTRRRARLTPPKGEAAHYPCHNGDAPARRAVAQGPCPCRRPARTARAAH